MRHYKWTGHRELLGYGNEGIIERKEILGYLGSKEKETLERYIRFVKDGLGIEEDYEGGGLIRSGGGKHEVSRRKIEEREMYDERILGGGDFVEEVMDRVEGEGRLIKKIVRMDEMVQRIISYYNITDEELLETRDKKVREARKVFVYMGNKCIGKSLVEMGRMLGITKEAASIARKGGKAIVEKKRVFEELIQ